FPFIRFIWNSENEGFARANNKALTQANGQYVLFLNPDTIVPEDCFEKCISFLNLKNDDAALGIKMIDGSGKFLKESKRAFPSPITSLYKISGLSRVFPESPVFSKYHLGHLDKSITHEVGVLAGAFMMIPKKIIDVVGCFDESFFMYGEDVDLSYRIQEAGYKNYYFAESAIIHFKGESTKKGSLNYVKMFYKAMSVFVRKHYGGTKAGVFNFLIQTAIFLRAVMAAVTRFLKWIGPPTIDAGIILISFWLIKIFWSNYVKQEVNYSPNMLIIAFPAFTLIFLSVSYFSGLYDNGFKQSRLNKSTAIAILVLLSLYSLLPENLRFSRGILLFGSLLAFLLITIVRYFLLRWKIINSAKEDDEINQTIVAGTEKDLEDVRLILHKAGMHERILGRIDTENKTNSKTVGLFENLSSLLHMYPVKEIIFCEGSITFKEIINSMPLVPKHIRIKIHGECTSSLAGSDSRNETGSYNSKYSGFRLSDTVNCRNKSLADVTISIVFLFSFPLHFIIKKRPLAFFKNVFDVLLLKKTWIGYAIPENELPHLKPGILTTTGLPVVLNTLSEEGLYTSDSLYAKGFHVLTDIKIIWLNYKFLS
ncbi:MAG: glycosyltransferase family 2 protein, partial [Ginsengibacter sp.]